MKLSKYLQRIFLVILFDYSLFHFDITPDVAHFTSRLLRYRNRLLELTFYRLFCSNSAEIRSSKPHTAFVYPTFERNSSGHFVTATSIPHDEVYYCFEARTETQLKEVWDRTKGLYCEQTGYVVSSLKLKVASIVFRYILNTLYSLIRTFSFLWQTQEEICLPADSFALRFSRLISFVGRFVVGQRSTSMYATVYPDPFDVSVYGLCNLPGWLYSFFQNSISTVGDYFFPALPSPSPLSSPPPSPSPSPLPSPPALPDSGAEPSEYSFLSDWRVLAAIGATFLFFSVTVVVILRLRSQRAYSTLR